MEVPLLFDARDEDLVTPPPPLDETSPLSALSSELASALLGFLLLLLLPSLLRSSRLRDHHRVEAAVLVFKYMLKFLRLRLACGTNLFADLILSACIPLAKNKNSVVKQIISTAARLYCRKMDDLGEGQQGGIGRG